MLDLNKKLILWQMDVIWHEQGRIFSLKHNEKIYKLKHTEKMILNENIIITYNDLVEYIKDRL